MLSTAPSHQLQILAPGQYWANETALVGLAPNAWHDGERLSTSNHDFVELNQVGQVLVESMSRRATIGDLTRRLQDEFGISHEVALRDTLQFLGDLQARHLISVEQRFGAELLHRMLGPVRLFGDTWGGRFPTRHTYPERRLTATPKRVVRSCIRAQFPVALAILMMAVVLEIQHVVRRTGQGESWDTIGPLMAAIAVCLVGYVALFVASSIAHELGHYAASRALGVEVRSVFTRFSRAGVAHDQTNDSGQAIIAASGGIPGFLVSGFAMVVLLMSPLESMWIFTSLAFDVAVIFSCGVLMLFHLASLTPITHEGRRLWSATGRALRS